MARIRKFQNSFATGEVSPAMYARMDYQKYEASCRLVRNAIVRPQGGAVKRSGLMLCDELKTEDGVDYTKCVMHPFVYNVTQSCVLLFVPYKVYIIANGHILRGDSTTTTDEETGETITKEGNFIYVETCYAESELRDLNLCQSADVLFIAHPNHPPMKLTRLSTDLRSWNFEQLAIRPSIEAPDKPTVTLINFGTINDSKCRDVDYCISAVSEDGEESLPSEETSVRIPTNWADSTKCAKAVLTWNAVEGAKRYNIYKNASSSYGWIGITEKLTFTDINMEGDSGTGYKYEGEPFALDGNNSGVLSAPTWAAKNYVTVTKPSSTTDFTRRKFYYKVCAVNASGLISNASESVTSGYVYYKTANLTAKTLSGYRSAVRASSTVSSVTLKWNTVSGASKYYIYCAIDNTSDANFCLIGEATQPKDDSSTETGDETGSGTATITTVATTQTFKDNFTATVNTEQHPNTAYPGVVAIFQQRLCFARSNMSPQTLWFSETGAYNSFAKHYPLIDSDAMTLTLDSRQANEIRHIIALKSILVMTSAAEYALNSKDGETQAITPSSASCQVQSYWGASKLQPITCGINVLFACNGGRRVRNLEYKFTENGFVGSDLSILSEHLLPSGIVDWALQKDPYGVIWAIREDGGLISLTYLPEQEVAAWSQHDSTNAFFISCSCIRENDKDVVYFLIRRTFDWGDGTTEDYFTVERMEERDANTPINESVFMDYAQEVECDETKNDSIYPGTDGLWWWNGDIANDFEGLEFVAINMEDGSVTRSVSVYGSGIPLGTKTGKYLVGLAYPMQLQTSPVEVKDSNGTYYADPKSVTSCVIDIEETQGVMAGSDFEHLEVVDYPPPVTPTLRSGAYKVPQLGNFKSEASVCIESREPYPCIIRGVETTIDVGTN